MTAAHPLDEVYQGPPGLLVFLSGADGGSCCAANYERMVFRDRKVLDLARRFATVRVDRAAAPAELLERFAVRRERAAIVLTDGDGTIRARFDACTSASLVATAMEQTLRATEREARAATKARELLVEAEAQLGREAFRDAGTTLRKVLRVEGAPGSAEVRASALLARIAGEGEARVAAALALPAPEARYDRLLALRHEFWDFDCVVRLRAELTALVEGDATREPIRAHRAATDVARAKELIAQGKKGEGRGLLRQVVREFEGTPAAAEAAALLEQS